MDENGRQSNIPNSYRNQEIFHRAQETQAGHRFPNPTGIVPVPRGSRGPRSLYLRRHGDSFGFTLRHFIVYPPDSIADDARHAAVGALLAPMDTIFVKHVRERGAARQAGLQKGDRLVAVNGVPVKDKSYAQVVQLVQASPEYLHLLVVPKEEDVLQRFFSETAYNPVSNQASHPDIPLDRQTAQQIISRRLAHAPNELQVDAISWRSLQQPYSPPDFVGLQRAPHDKGQRSADNLLARRNQQEIYAEIHPHDLGQRGRCRAAPQVPLYKKMGRRASAGNVLADREPDYLSAGDMTAAYKSNYLQLQDSGRLGSNGGQDFHAGNPDASRRESSCSSLSSSLADGSFDSSSTLTGLETDDSAMSRVRESVRRKEAFLGGDGSIRREFYGQPKRLEGTTWPPEGPRVGQKVRNDVDLAGRQRENGGGAALAGPQQRGAVSPRQRADVSSDRAYEGATAPEGYDSMESANGSAVGDAAYYDDRRIFSPPLQIVHKRAKDFESGRPLPEDDPVQTNRMNFSRSELARLSSKKLVPNVCERAHEYETKAVIEPRRDAGQLSTNSSQSTGKKVQRDARSLDSSGSSASVHEILFGAFGGSKGLSGNVTISSGSKYLHCPPPAEWQSPGDGPSTDVLSESTKFRARSNSAESWVGALGEDRDDIGRIRRQDAAGHVSDRNKEKAVDQPVVVKRRPKPTNIAEDERAMRRESYLKATEGGRMHIDSDMSDGGDISPQALRSVHRRWRPPIFPGDIQQLRKLFEDAASSLGGSASSSSASLDREKASGSPSPLDKDKYTIVREGSLHCKVLEIDGKRAADRSWKQVFIVLKGPKLFVYKDRHNQSPIGTSDALDQSLSGGVDMRTSVVRVAEDYTKRKNVLRVSAVEPCRSEFLLQADSADEFADWVKTLQEQVAASTEAELEPSHNKQQAVPQLVPASATFQVQGSQLSQQLNKPKTTASRNRSPTGQSPVSKSRKPSHVPEPTSPKSKTWRGRMVKQLKRFNQGANSPSSPTAPEGSTFGVPIDDCLPSASNVYLPRFVEVCTDIIDERGLQTVGIYRVPGNNASITALTEEVNKNYDDVPLEDSRWNDLHVVGSLLKSYFRKMPDSLITVHLYPSFIKADKIDNPKERMEQLRRLVRSLPKHNYHTLKHLILHLKRVADNCPVNKMEAKNLAIVFGPTIIRPEGETMESMVNHMTNQCKIVETLVTHADWFFPENDNEENLPVPIGLPDSNEDLESVHNQALLLHNISKYEALKDSKEKNGALFSSIISAAQRKVKRKPNKGSTLQDCKEEAVSPTNIKIFPAQSFSSTDLKECSSPDCKMREEIPTTVMDIEKKAKTPEKVPWFKYESDKDDFRRRIENFKQETEAMLQLRRKTEISVINIDTQTMGQLSSSACNVNQNGRLSLQSKDIHHLTKTHSASNVFANGSDTSNFSVQYSKSSKSNANGKAVGFGDANETACSDSTDGGEGHERLGRGMNRRVGAVGVADAGSMEVSNGNLKKVKYETENNCVRTESLEPLHKLTNDDDSLLSTMTKLLDQKLKEDHATPSITVSGDIPFADDPPEKPPLRKSYPDKENIPQASDLYRNPSLHKFGNSKSQKKVEKEAEDKEKEEDTMAIDNVPDNDKNVNINKPALISNNKDGSKLRRSGSLNKPERNMSPLSSKLKRSESLNKSGEKLKRSDSLTKTEKTESNINKRRELVMSNRRFKDSTKHKRKNGMPDRSIKRRHTVGGTKDPDKITWVMDNKSQEETNNEAENRKEKNLRTSSPDLSSTRRDRFFFEINLIGPDNMVVALRQHLAGSRPQSFPESNVFKVPLESHV